METRKVYQEQNVALSHPDKLLSEFLEEDYIGRQPKISEAPPPSPASLSSSRPTVPHVAEIISSPSAAHEEMIEIVIVKSSQPSSPPQHTMANNQYCFFNNKEPTNCLTKGVTSLFSSCFQKNKRS